MLVMKPSCECCDRDLAADSDEAMICSFECTFCKSCVEDVLHSICPNCSGSFTARPSRVGEALKNNPMHKERIFNPALLTSIKSKNNEQ